MIRKKVGSCVLPGAKKIARMLFGFVQIRPGCIAAVSPQRLRGHRDSDFKERGRRRAMYARNLSFFSAGKFSAVARGEL
jgi:hypothetical protein